MKNKIKQKENKKYYVIIITLIIGFVLGHFIIPNTKIINNTIYSQPDNVVRVELNDGWECEEPKIDTDLLQPNGYWVGSTINCWKLETPIQEYNIKMCKETKDDYFCDSIINNLKS